MVKNYNQNDTEEVWQTKLGLLVKFKIISCCNVNGHI
jgi:hypothetical protein